MCFIGPELPTSCRYLGTLLHAHRTVHAAIDKDAFELQHPGPGRAAKSAGSGVHRDEVDVHAAAREQPHQLRRKLW